MDDTDGEKFNECPYKNRQNGDDNDVKENTKLEEAVKEAEENTALTPENTTG